jgi:hypothetical protein
VKKSLVILAFLLIPFVAFAQTSSPSSATIDTEKGKLIRTLLGQTREVEMAQERIAQAQAGLKQMMPRLPEKYWEKYRSLISENELRDRLAQVYDKRYTTDEIKSLIEFYGTPAGKKLSENAVPILRDSMTIAQEMSRRAAQTVTSEVNAERLLQDPVSSGSFSGMLLTPGAPGAAASPTPATAASP